MEDTFLDNHILFLYNLVTRENIQLLTNLLVIYSLIKIVIFKQLQEMKPHLINLLDFYNLRTIKGIFIALISFIIYLLFNYFIK